MSYNNYRLLITVYRSPITDFIVFVNNFNVKTLDKAHIICVHLLTETIVNHYIMKTLRFTTTKPCSMFSLVIDEQQPIINPNRVNELIGSVNKNIYIHGDAQSLAGFDIPIFIDGDFSQLEKPIEEQDIVMILPNGEWKCKAEYYDAPLARNCYLITLKLNLN